MSVRNRKRPAALGTRIRRLCWLGPKTEPECTLDSIDKAVCTPRTRIVVKDYGRLLGLIVWVERRRGRGEARGLAFSPPRPPSRHNTDTALRVAARSFFPSGSDGASGP
jgi:hypothetical protein